MPQLYVLVLPELWIETSGSEKNGCTKIVHKDLRVTKEF